MTQEKDTYLAPLYLLRDELIATRRSAANRHMLNEVVAAQLQLEAVERAMLDETKAPH